jgi:methionyl-tRNA formyltransferase
MALDPQQALPSAPLRRPLRAAFFGTPALALPTLEAMLARPDLCEVVAVVAQPDKPVGRGKKMRPPPVAKRASELGLPLFQPRRIRTGAFPEALEALDLDVAVVIAYGRILTTRHLETPRFGCINVHASLLPAWRGAGPIQWAIIEGDERSGITTMWMEEGLDTGPILQVAEIPIAARDTSSTLGSKLATLGADLLTETLTALQAGTLTARPQPAEGSSYARILTKDDGILDWSRSAVALDRQVRGLTPWPGTFCGFRGDRLKVHTASVGDAGPPIASGASAEAGTIVALTPDSIDVSCGRGVLRLTQVQPPGRKAQQAGDFVRGYHPKLGESLRLFRQDDS